MTTFLTVYVTSWDEPSQYHLKNLSGFRHKVIDIDKNPDIANEQQIKAVPTTQIYVDEELRVSKIGAAPKAVIESWIKEVI
jgi:thioredoxin-like negative regulator of GroEL